MGASDGHGNYGRHIRPLPLTFAQSNLGSNTISVPFKALSMSSAELRCSELSMVRRFFCSAPVRSPLALATDDTHKLLRNDSASLLTRMQRIKPLKAVWASIDCTVLSTHGRTRLTRSRDIERCSAIQILRRIGVNISHKAVDVVICEVSARVLLRDESCEGRTVFVYVVQGCDSVLHAVVHVGLIASVCRPELSCGKAALGRELVLGEQIQWRQVQENEVAPAVLVEAIDRVVHAVDVV